MRAVSLSSSVRNASCINNRAALDALTNSGLKLVSPEKTTDIPSESTFHPTAPEIWSAGKQDAVVVGPRLTSSPGSTTIQRMTCRPSELVAPSRSLPVYFGNVQVAGGAHFYRPIQRFSGQLNLKSRSILAFQRQYKLDEQQTRQMVWMMAGNQYLVETLHWNAQFGSASSH